MYVHTLHCTQHTVLKGKTGKKDRKITKINGWYGFALIFWRYFGPKTSPIWNKVKNNQTPSHHWD